MQTRVTVVSPSWQEWQLVGISVGVSELKFACLVGVKVGKAVGKVVGQTWHVTGHAALILAPCVLCLQYAASWIHAAGFPPSFMPVDARSAQAAQQWLLYVTISNTVMSILAARH